VHQSNRPDYKACLPIAMTVLVGANVLLSTPTNAAPVVTGNTINLPDDGWYQVQDSTTYASLCEGTRECEVPKGQYIVINLTTGERFEPIDVTADTQPANNDRINLPAPLKLAERCIGNINEAGTQYCVNPDTREFSATTADSALWWSFTLPSDNATNSIETVLTVGDFVLLVANRFPGIRQLTYEQRAQQFEVSVFEDSGNFLRTIPLELSLGVAPNDEPQNVIYRGDQFSGIPARVVAFQQNEANPQLLFGWHRFRTFGGSRVHKWDLAGVSRFDLVTGERLNDKIYPEQQIDELALDQNQPGLVRVTTTKNIEWLNTQTLNLIPNDYFKDQIPNTIVGAPETEQNQINASNYLEIISRVIPWATGDHTEPFFSEEELIIFNNEANVFERGSDDGTYRRTVSTCDQSGINTQLQVRNVSIVNSMLDNCRFNSLTYDGSYQADYVGRDGSGRRVDLTTFDNAGVTSTGALRSSTYFNRILGGRARFHEGTTINYGANRSTEAVADYRIGGDFFYGRNSNLGNTCTSERNAADEFLILNCTIFTARGNIDSRFTLNADWSSHTNLDVELDLSFGDLYYTDFSWFNTTTNQSLPDKPIPQFYLDRQKPPEEFIISEGSLTVEATDGSRIVANSVGNSGETVTMQVSVFDRFNNSLGNFAEISFNVLCRQNFKLDCVVPQ